MESAHHTVQITTPTDQCNKTTVVEFVGMDTQEGNRGGRSGIDSMDKLSGHLQCIIQLSHTHTHTHTHTHLSPRNPLLHTPSELTHG